MEAIVEGGISDKDLEVAAIAILDIKANKIINVIQIEGAHHTGAGHAIFIVPLSFSSHPAEDSCFYAGEIAAKNILQITDVNSPKIIVVAAKDNPYETLFSFSPIMRKHKEKQQQKIYLDKTVKRGEPEKLLQLYHFTLGENLDLAHDYLCKAADQNHPDARYRLAILYEHGHEKLVKNLHKAYIWYALASESGHYWASHHMVRIKKEIINSKEFSYTENALLNWKSGQCAIDLGLK